VKKVLIVFTLLFSGIAYSQNQCGLSTLGGIDTFPWSVAEPFPWNRIQGLWKVSNDSNTIIKFRVNRTDSQSKKLSIEVYLRNQDCLRPAMTGLGIINSSEKNIVRATLKDHEGHTNLLKLAWFNSEILQLSGNNCDPNVLLASLVNLSDESSFANTEFRENEAPQMMLKKITGSLDFYCKKRK